jgi:hypothetical protein
VIGARKNASRPAMITARVAPRLAAFVPRLAVKWLVDHYLLIIWVSAKLLPDWVH